MGPLEGVPDPGCNRHQNYYPPKVEQFAPERLRGPNRKGSSSKGLYETSGDLIHF